VAERDPSVSSLADALSRSESPAGPVRPRVALARPAPLSRVLFAAVLVLALIFLAALLVLGSRVRGLVTEMRLERGAREHREREALPPESVLRDADMTRRETQARPQAAGPIWQARCALLAAAGDWTGVDETCVQVGLSNPGDLLPGTRLLHAESLHRLGRQAEAGRILHAIDQSGLDDGGRARAADLAGRLWNSVEGSAEQSGKPAAE
jgi:hypothetical protein